VLGFFVHREFGDEAKNQCRVGGGGGANVNSQGNLLDELKGGSTPGEGRVGFGSDVHRSVYRGLMASA
jgi:hypothetical protein